MTGYLQARDEALADPSAFWLAAAERIDWVEPPTVGLDDSAAPLYRWFPDGVLNTCANAVDRHVAAGRGDVAAIRYDSPVTGTKATDHLRGAARPGLALRGGARRSRRGSRRPSARLHADDPRGGRGHARLRAPGGGALRRVRRVRAGRARGAHRRRRADGDRLGQLRHRAVASGGVQAAARRGAAAGPPRARRVRRPAAPEAARGDGGARRRLARAHLCLEAAWPGAGARDGSALHPLHLGHDGTTQGRRARQRRPRGRDGLVVRQRLRDGPRRHLVGGVGRRLGRRPLVHRLRAAHLRRDYCPVRGEAGRHPGRGSVLARDRRVRSGRPVHRSHGDPRDQEGGPRGAPHPGTRPVLAARPVPRRRAARSGHLLLGCRPARGPRRRQLVADGDGLADRQQPARARADDDQAGLARPCRFRGTTSVSWTARAWTCRPGRTVPSSSGSRCRQARCRPCGATTSATSTRT